MGEVTKPWEETWTIYDQVIGYQGGISFSEKPVEAAWITIEAHATTGHRAAALEKTPARLKLAAAAPELARALLQFGEWFDDFERGSGRILLIDVLRETEAALRKAGVR
jgi:hypothetical protein